MPIKTRNENPEAVKRRKSLKILNKRHLWLLFLAKKKKKKLVVETSDGKNDMLDKASASVVTKPATTKISSK